AADRNKTEARRQHFAAVVLTRRKKAHGLAGLLDALASLDDGGPDLWPLPVVGMAVVGGQVGGPDEDAVDALDGSDLLDGGDRLAGLDLHQHAELAVGAPEIIRNAAVTGRARHPSDAADALRWIARCLYGAACLLGRLHEREEQRACALVEHALDRDRLVPRHPHDRLGSAAFGGTELIDDLRQVVGRMLHVEQEPVEPRARHHLGGDRATQRHPEADLGLLLGERAPELVLRQVVSHHLVLDPSGHAVKRCSAASTASPMPTVDTVSLPSSSSSAVRFSVSARWIARSSRRASSSRSNDRASAMPKLWIAASGLALFWPATSGALPCTGS